MRFLFNPVIAILIVFIYVGFVGPFLISAPSTELVVLGTLGALFVGGYAKLAFDFYLKGKK